MKIKLLVALGVVLMACNNAPRQEESEQTFEPFNIDLEQALENPKQLKVSEIGDSIRYFELKTPKELPIKVSQVYLTDENIFIIGFFMQSGPIHRFDLAGNHLGKIGAIGRGPGEYHEYVQRLLVDENRKEILVDNYTQYVIYSFDGKYLRTEEVADSKTTRYSQLYNDLLCSAFEPVGNTAESKLVVTNQTGDTVVRIPNYNMYDVGKYSFATTSTFFNPFYSNNGKLYFKGFEENDTIFNIMEDKADVHAIINMGKYKRTEPVSLKEYFARNKEINGRRGDYYYAKSVFEDDNYIYLKCRPAFNQAMGSPIILFDKKLRTGYNLKDENGEKGIIDDLCGGATFVPMLITDEYYLEITNADDFIDRNEGRENLSGELKELLENITYESNPIVTLVKRK